VPRRVRGAGGPRPCPLELELHDPERGAPTFVWARARERWIRRSSRTSSPKGLPREIVDAARTLGARSGGVFPPPRGRRDDRPPRRRVATARRAPWSARRPRAPVARQHRERGLRPCARRGVGGDIDARGRNALAEASRSLLTRTAKKDVLVKQILAALVKQFGTTTAPYLLVEPRAEVVLESDRAGAWAAAPRRGSASTGPASSPGRSGTGNARQRLRCPAGRSLSPGWPSACRSSSCRSSSTARWPAPSTCRLRAPRRSARSTVRMLTAFAERCRPRAPRLELVAELEERTRVLEGVVAPRSCSTSGCTAPDVLSSFVRGDEPAFPELRTGASLCRREDGKTLSIAAAYGLGKSTQAGHRHGADADRALSLRRARLVEDRPHPPRRRGLDELRPSARRRCARASAPAVRERGGASAPRVPSPASATAGLGVIDDPGTAPGRVRGPPTPR